MTTRPHAFVAMPFGIKLGADGQPIDFNRVYGEYIAPALEAAGLESFRADEEVRAGDIRTDMFQSCGGRPGDRRPEHRQPKRVVRTRRAPRVTRLAWCSSGGRVPAAFDLYTDRKVRDGVKDGGPGRRRPFRPFPRSRARTLPRSAEAASDRSGDLGVARPLAAWHRPGRSPAQMREDAAVAMFLANRFLCRNANASAEGHPFRHTFFDFVIGIIADAWLFGGGGSARRRVRVFAESWSATLCAGGRSGSAARTARRRTVAYLTSVDHASRAPAAVAEQSFLNLRWIAARLRLHSVVSRQQPFQNRREIASFLCIDGLALSSTFSLSHAIQR
jgi:hypothetical protein